MRAARGGTVDLPQETHPAGSKVPRTLRFGTSAGFRERCWVQAAPPRPSLARRPRPQVTCAALGRWIERRPQPCQPLREKSDGRLHPRDGPHITMAAQPQLALGSGARSGQQPQIGRRIA